jgi:hypothetical protein
VRIAGCGPGRDAHRLRNPIFCADRDPPRATTTAQLEKDIAAAQCDLDAATLADLAALQRRHLNPAG